MKRIITFIMALALAVSVQLANPRALAQTVANTPAVGDTVGFGLYDQVEGCEGEKSVIEWTVLDEKDGMLLLLANSGLETGAFNEEKQRVTWAECSLRTWLNCAFLFDAFSAQEQDAIQWTELATPGGSFTSPVTHEKIRISPAPDTVDKVFLLSVAETLKYMPKTTQRRSLNNPYLLDKPEESMPYPAEADPCDFTYGNWWLRDVRKDNGIKSGFHVKSNGSIASAGQINLQRYVIRPALWVDAFYPFNFGY